MSIIEYASSTMSDEEIEMIVHKIVSKLGTSSRDFDHASQQYNSDFFKGEPADFKTRLCSALSRHFTLTNTFWSKNAE